ncbi:MAG: HAD hydrolase family protein [Desulfobacteraceae bacterium]|jgi:3-deoxy-D-manno-octulosonate 8-phosphate phosphatase (KDO 8-P phosphatase)
MIADKLKKIKLLLLDVDGVLTDGSIIFNDKGQESKQFNVKDGFGMKLLMSVGIQLGIVTGRRSMALTHRCNDLGIRLIFDGISEKASILDEIQRRTGISTDNIAFVGDDIPDLALMRRIGVSIAVANAHENVRAQADWVTSAPGGAGAVREVCEAILKSQGTWDNILEHM